MKQFRHLSLGQPYCFIFQPDIDFGFSEARTTYGVIGVKCWVYKGEILPGGPRKGLRNEPEPRRAPRPERRDRDRDRGDRDRGPRPVAPAPEHGAVQGAPIERTAAPILPPMAAPAAPTWKQDSKPEVVAPESTPPESPKPEGTEPEGGKE